jgi:hypothetical protein
MTSHCPQNGLRPLGKLWLGLAALSVVSCAATVVFASLSVVEEPVVVGEIGAVERITGFGFPDGTTLVAAHWSRGLSTGQLGVIARIPADGVEPFLAQFPERNEVSPSSYYSDENLAWIRRILDLPGWGSEQGVGQFVRGSWWGEGVSPESAEAFVDDSDAPVRTAYFRWGH